VISDSGQCHNNTVAGNGHDYRDLIAAYAAQNYGPLGVEVFTEVRAGTTIIGKRRCVDVFLLRGNLGLSVECKFQDVNGTADEKIPYALEDLESPWHAGCLVYAGDGWSQGVLHMLRASHRAAGCLPDVFLVRSDKTIELDFIVAAHFGLWSQLLPSERRFDTSTCGTTARTFFQNRNEKQHARTKRAIESKDKIKETG
jgi:hypothetical protein